MPKALLNSSKLIVPFLVCFALGLPAAQAQSRLSDKDIDTSLKNLQDDTRHFRDTFNSALKKSIIRKTSQEKDAREMAKTFEAQLDSVCRLFKDKRRVDNRLSAVLASRDRIDSFLSSISLGDQTNSEWGKIKAELATLSRAFNMGS
jgi:hypothetical protein